MQTPPSMCSASSSQPGRPTPARLTASPAMLASTMGMRSSRHSGVPGLSIQSPSEKCSSISTMNRTTAAGSAASPKASSSSGIPMLPELLNIIGGRKVFGLSFSHFTSGQSSTPEPTTITAPPSARPA